MIVSLSFRDVLKAYPAFKNEVGLLPLEAQRFLEPELYQLGFDTSKAIEVRESLHRDSSNKVAVGYEYVGWERQDKEWLHSNKSSISVHIYRHKDTSLVADLLALNQEDVGSSPIHGVMTLCAERDANGDFLMDRYGIRPDYDENTKLLQSMKEVRERVRDYYDTLHDDHKNELRKDPYGNRFKKRQKELEQQEKKQ